MRFRTRFHGRRRGAAAVELALSLLALSPILVGLLEVSRIVEIQQILNNAAREGGRQASTGRITTSQAQQAVTLYLKNAGLSSLNSTVTVNNLTEPGVDPTVAAQFDQFQVTVKIPFKDVHWVSLQLVTNVNTNLTAQSNWYSVKDKPYPPPAAPPIE